MSISTNLIITSKNGNKLKTTNLTHVNPDAADNDLAAGAAALFGLSSHTFVGVERVDKRVLTIAPAVELQNPNLTVTLNSETVGDSVTLSKDAGYSMAHFDVSCNGSGVITVSDTQNYLSFDSSTNRINQSFGVSDPKTGDSTTVTVNLASDGTYDSATKVFTLTYAAASANNPVDPSSPVDDEPIMPG